MVRVNKKLQQVDEQKDDNSSTSPLVPLKQELYTLQANCTNPHVIGLVRKKLRAIRKSECNGDGRFRLVFSIVVPYQPYVS
ncbi:unnamed protein product [Heterobilharzia americana]|nr:unnamed protein product [Heterobilharzia americana]